MGFSGPEFPVSGDKGVLLPPDTGRMAFTWQIYFLISGRQRRIRVSFLHKLALKQLQFKIINMSSWHILGQPALNPISAKVEFRLPLPNSNKVNIEGRTKMKIQIFRELGEMIGFGVVLNHGG